MITIRKLSSLNKKTALRKVVLLLKDFETDLAAGKAVDTGYLSSLVSQIIVPAVTPDPDALRRLCNDLRHQLNAYLGTSQADWDLMPPAGLPGSPGDSRCDGPPIRVFLENLRSPFNVGSVFRSAEAFRVDRVTLTPSCPRPDSPRAARSAMGSNEIVPWSVSGLEGLQDAHVFALETGGIPIEEFDFPYGGTVILGNEELGVSPEGLALAERGAGIVSIPLYGVKGSLNVTAAFAILIYFWRARLRRGEDPHDSDHNAGV